MTAGRIAGSLALTVHGTRGAVDLVVPPDATAMDLAREYAAQLGLTHVPPLLTPLGESLTPGDVLSSRGLVSGDLLVVAEPVGAPADRHRRALWRAALAGRADDPPGPLSALLVALAAAAALTAGWLAPHLSAARQDTVVWLLLAGAATGLVPTGRLAPRRAVVAPFLAGAAAYAIAWDPAPERLPTIIGVGALAAAVTAAVARAFDRRAEEALRVWIVAGVLVFSVSCGAALLDLAPRVVWAVLLAVAVLGARVVPSQAVDVPDGYLVDLERLAVSAWSARAQPGRRGRTLVPVGAVADVAARGARIVQAAAGAVLALVLLAAPLLLAGADLPVDRVGARLMVGLAGISLLFTARSYRYAVPRGLLRAAGLWCLACDAVVLLPRLDAGRTVLVVGGAVVVALGVLAAAVATGRGWRSAWWAARAELAEALAMAGTLALLVVATGFFRALWESHFGV
ncbi:hypothetical protein P5P86_02745 [Nocardioides sp. BP30]|uniref:hypothetical protein n=1 Tax=Nocardioides sp. BP30 TaxID=3036374 RepID=UPI0024684974|nr:hypothetical protein [Nocardioides sp. BP30]WGL52751.1 hypothetical protein P5P86_02745 [Nocardioides sp. BP30]